MSYQGDELANALLEFNEGESLTEIGRFFLYIFGANCYNTNGLAKLSYVQREEWVKSNKNNILEMKPEFMLGADSKINFTAFCLVMRELEKDPNYKVNLPIFLDATCSGIQHLAALIRDLELASRVNLKPQTNDNKVEDIYSEIVDPINKEINDFGDKNILFGKFKEIKFDRKILKLSIMTKVYNVTIYGIAEQLADVLESREEIIERDSDDQYDRKEQKIIYFKAPTKNNGFVELQRSDLFIIAKIIHEKVFIMYPSLRHIYDYFISIAKLFVKLKIPLSWFTPSGLFITQNYLKSEAHKLSFKIGGLSNSLVLRKITDRMDTAKQVQAIIPNVIHSLDASHLINIINTAIKNKFGPILTIHDCFGTHPNKMGYLSDLVKKEFVLLYSEANFLDKFHNNVIEWIKKNNFEVLEEKKGKTIKYTIFDSNENKYYVPEKPKMGKLKYKNILKSKYIIT